MAEYEGKLHINNGTSYDDLKLDTNAEYVKYDNTISGLTATNTKTAIDELDANVDLLGIKEVKVLTGTTGAVGVSNTIAYPTNFTVDNTIITAIMVYTSTSRWYNVLADVANTSCSSYLQSANIQLTTGSTATSYATRPYKLVLARY